MEMTNYPPTDGVRHIRARLDHPLIDSDGHLIEFLLVPGTADRAGRRVGGSALRRRRAQQSDASGSERRRAQAPRHHRGPCWSISTGNILDRATALFPRLHYARLDELRHDSPYELRPNLAAGPGIREYLDQGRRNQRRCRSIGITGSSSP